jgi:hypothetical protein
MPNLKAREMVRDFDKIFFCPDTGKVPDKNQDFPEFLLLKILYPLDEIRVPSTIVWILKRGEIVLIVMSIIFLYSE